MIRLTAILWICLILSLSWASAAYAQDDPWKKVEIDLTQLDADGLWGPRDGKVAVSYEFSIPNTEQCKRQVQAMDRTVKFMPGSRGRTGTDSKACLCIGSTLQKNYRAVLLALAGLPFIDRIIECHFE